jgi:hypothetical protein
MNAVQLDFEFDNRARGHSKLQGVNLTTLDKQGFLNQSQELLIRKYYETFYKDEKSRLYLERLIRTKVYDVSEGFVDSTIKENGRYFTLPETLKFVMMEEVTMTDGIETIRPRIKSIMNPHYNLNDLNPFKRPYRDMAWRLSYGLDSVGVSAKTHQIIVPTGWELVKYYLDYLKYPTIIDILNNTTPELDETIHTELVDTAIELAVKAYQVGNTIEKT